MTQSPSRKIAIYSRKSKFTGKGDSVENQIELCRQYIKEHYKDIKETDILIYEDEGFSGSNMERPQFKRMMEDARTKKFTAIVCYRLDRISRNIGDFANLIEKLNSLQINFVSIKEQFDTKSPMGRAMMYIASVFSQLERETIAERIRDNMMELAKTGRWLGGVTPTGYKSEAVEKITVDGRIRKIYRLTPVPEEEKLIKLIFDIFLQNKSLTKTETFLIQNNFKTKNNKNFSRFTIKNILQNPVYMIADTDAYNYFLEKSFDLFSQKSDFDGIHGMMAYNKTIQVRGKANKQRDPVEWIVAVGRHKGFISGADWVLAQHILDQNKSKFYRKPKSRTALLSGLLYCGNCGSYMRPKLTQRKNKHGQKIYSYLCELKEKSRCKKCNMKRPGGNLLDETICNEIKKITPDRTELIHQLENNYTNIIRSSNKLNEQISHLKKTYQENIKNISILVSSVAKASGTEAEKYIINQIEELHKNNEFIEKINR